MAQKKGPFQVIGKGLFQCALILPVLLSRLQSSLPHVLLHGFNGNFFPVENARRQGGFHISLFKDL
jgi:hypothetical protein